MDLANWIGLAGAALLLLAYAKGRAGTRATESLNLCGAAGLVTDGIVHGVPGMYVLNGFWCAVALTRLCGRGSMTDPRSQPG